MGTFRDEQNAAAEVIERIRAIARPLGWAIGVHGSLARDIDLIGATWTDGACSAADLILAVSQGIGYERHGMGPNRGGRHCAILLAPGAKRLDAPEGKGHWAPMAIDLSLVDGLVSGNAGGAW